MSTAGWGVCRFVRQDFRPCVQASTTQGARHVATCQPGFPPDQALVHMQGWVKAEGDSRQADSLHAKCTWTGYPTPTHHPHSPPTSMVDWRAGEQPAVVGKPHVLLVLHQGTSQGRGLRTQSSSVHQLAERAASSGHALLRRSATSLPARSICPSGCRRRRRPPAGSHRRPAVAHPR